MNLKIKMSQSFGGTHRGRVCVHVVFIGVSAHTCMIIYVCTVFLKKKLNESIGIFELKLGLRTPCLVDVNFFS
jgi:hypothetical protein